MTVYVINAYDIIETHSASYILSRALGAKISSPTLMQILMGLNQQDKREITENSLIDLALQYEVDIEDLKQLLISKLHVLTPLLSKKIPFIYLNADDSLVEGLLCDTLKTEYKVQCCPRDCVDFQTPALVIYYRQNYSDSDFKQVHQALMDGVYLITCGVLHHQLVIDNLYFNHSGLPTHDSNLHHLMKDNSPDGFLRKNDSLSFYRRFIQCQTEALPTLSLSPCQRGYIAYAIYQFIAPFVKFDGQPTPHDAINWRWHVDLLTFGVQKEVAILAEPVFNKDSA